MLMRRWTPPSQVPTTSLDGHHHQRTFLRWTKVFIYLIIAITLIVFCTIYTIQKENFFNEEYNRQQRDEQNRENKLFFKYFLDDISKLMDTNSIDLIQTKILMIISKLTQQQKQELLFFLYSQKFLDNSTRINLQNMDFNNIELFCSNHFQQIHLFGVQLKNAIFHNCHFKFANFQQSNLFNSQFINSTIENTSFIRTNLDQSQFIRSNIRNVDFTDASLIQSNFLQANIVQGNRFLNADLYHANITEDQINGKYMNSISQENDFTNARLPDGHFRIKKFGRNLIINGTNCANLNQPIWQITNQTMNISFTNSLANNCELILSAKARIYQKISLNSYSLLINKKEVKLSFYLQSSCNESTVDIDMYDFNNIRHQLYLFNHSNNNTDNNTNSTIYEFYYTLIDVPKHTQYMQIYLNNQEYLSCYFTNMNFTIEYDANN